MKIIRTFGNVVGGTLLISGVTFGVGIAGLPVATADAGFIPSLLLLLGAWAIMLCSGLLVLEACIWMPKNAHLSTLSFQLLGKWGGSLAWILYLALFLCLMATQAFAGGQIVGSWGFAPEWAANLLYVAIIAPVAYLGIRWVDRVNIFLLGALVIALLLFAVPASHYITPAFLSRAHWGQAGGALSVVLGCFAFQSLIPTLFNHMNRNVTKVRFSLIAGTIASLILYAVWEFLILGTIPAQGLKSGAGIVGYIQNHAVLEIGRAIAFFAITVSLLGISLAFVDFLIDGFKVGRKSKSRAYICLGIFAGALLMAGFDIPGPVQGISLLFGAMPALMVWAGRYSKGYSLYHRQLPGGKLTLSFLLVPIAYALIKSA